MIGKMAQTLTGAQLADMITTRLLSRIIVGDGLTMRRSGRSVIIERTDGHGTGQVPDETSEWKTYGGPE